MSIRLLRNSISSYMKNIVVAGVISFFLIAVASCTKSSELGLNIFANDQINALFTDTLSISAINESNDSVLMYNYGSTPFDSLLVGKINDSLFGLTQSQIFFKPLSLNLPNLGGAVFDSVVMVMGYSVANNYGDTTDMQTLEVYRLTENMALTDVIYSNKKFAQENSPIGRLSFVPSPNTTSVSYTRDTAAATKFDTTYTKPQLRIRLDQLNSSLVNILKSLDTTVLGTSVSLDSLFDNQVNGFTICAKRTSKCMLSLNLSNSASTATNAGAGIYIYYKFPGDTTRYSFHLQTGSISPRSTYFTSDIKKSFAGKYLNSSATSGDYLLLQGMAGPNIKFEIPSLKAWKGNQKIAINKAELEFTLKTTDAQTYLWSPIQQLLGRKSNAAFIADFSDNASLSLSALPYFYSGGYLVNSDTTVNVYKQKINLTHQLQRILDGVDGPTLYLIPNQKQIVAARSIFYGTKDAKRKPKLSITYTVLK